MAFELHPRLAADGLWVGDWPLSRVLLMNDAHYPWCILVPRREGSRDIHHLGQADRLQLLAESCQLSEAMEQLFRPFKMNVAALGNVVPQLHVHHIARFEGDPAWPGPVWGKLPAQPYLPTAAEERIVLLRQALGLAG
ncbi:MAG: HIT domain-containing protein [Gammaproteobacteria bacterium]|nr:MAG: HIT domain-containing protein [Gammaproteobacteria bacterium]